MIEFGWRHVPPLIAGGQIVVLLAMDRWLPGLNFEPMTIALISVLLVLIATVGWGLLSIQEEVV